MTWRVGTSGWQYRDWRGRLYPEGLPQRLWLERYAEIFDTVEVNAAFYRLPERRVFENWAARTPTDFVVAVKASRFLTHVRRLRQPAEPVARLLDRAAGLGARLGPVLLQLPPTLPADAALLDDCLACFPASVRVAVEPREASWWQEDVRRVLQERGAALVWADRGEEAVSPLWVTAPWAYLRLHCGRGQWRYGDAALATWGQRLRSSFAEGYVYANNDPGGAAVEDALRLRALLQRGGSPAPGGAGDGRAGGSPG